MFRLAKREHPLRNQDKRRVLLSTGTVLLAAGLLFLAAGLDGLRMPIPCAINGCPSIFSETYATYWYEIYAGIAMIALGIGLIFASRRIRPDAEGKHSTAAPSSLKGAESNRLHLSRDN